MPRPILRILILILILLLAACEDSARSVDKTVYIELPGSHFRNYAYAVGTVTEERNGQYKIRIDEINSGATSDNKMLKEMRLGRFIQMPRDEVLQGEDAFAVIEQSRKQILAVDQLIQSALSLNQLEPATIQTVQTVADTGNQPEISCTLDLVGAQASTPWYRDNALQLDSAAKAIESMTRILDQYGRYEAARQALRHAADQDACISIAVRLLRETDYDLRAYVAGLRGSDTEQLRTQMEPVRAINHALLDFQTGHFTDIPNGRDEGGYSREKLAGLTIDLRRHYGYQYIRDFRHDLDTFKQSSDVIERFQEDKESSQILADVLGGEILTERNLNDDYLNYYKLNKQLPVSMSKDLDDDNYYQRAREGFTVVDPSDEQRIMGLEHYLRDYPQGRHVEEARTLIEALKARISEGHSPTGLPEVARPQEPAEIPSQLPEERP